MLNRIDEWFDKYQAGQDKEKMSELYLKLIDEEIDELRKSLREYNLVEFLDAVADVYWVCKWYEHFSWISTTFNPIEKLKDYITCYQNIDEDTFIHIFQDLLTVVTDSNFSKELSLQTEWEKVGKVIKGDKFISPTKWIKKIIQEYNIKFIEA